MVNSLTLLLNEQCYATQGRNNMPVSLNNKDKGDTKNVDLDNNLGDMAGPKMNLYLLLLSRR